jgi:hypothetical protein
MVSCFSLMAPDMLPSLDLAALGIDINAPQQPQQQHPPALPPGL